MANEHLVLCGGAGPTVRKRAWRKAPTLALRLGKKASDVHLGIEHFARQLCGRVPDVATDLLEIAAYVYAADQGVRRGGTKEFDYGERWCRHFRFVIPVRRPDV